MQTQLDLRLIEMLTTSQNQSGVRTTLHNGLVKDGDHLSMAFLFHRRAVKLELVYRLVLLQKFCLGQSLFAWAMYDRELHA